MISEIIKKRVSTRTFSAEYLTQSHKEELNSFIEQNCPGIKIIEISDSEKPMKLLYGAIKGNKTYALGVTKHSREERLWYGYNMEKLVLKATEMGIAMCHFQLSIAESETPGEWQTIPGIKISGQPLLQYVISWTKK